MSARRPILVFGTALLLLLALAYSASAETRLFAFGGLGNVFSTGLNDLCVKARKSGISCSVHAHYDQVLSAAIAAHRAGKKIVLVGHSKGGETSAAHAVALGARRIPVALVVALDTVWGSPDLPCNVLRVVDFKSAGWIASLSPGAGCRTRAKGNRFPSTGHTTIDDSPDIHRRIIAEAL